MVSFFDPPGRVRTQLAKQDRIDITLGNWRLFGDGTPLFIDTLVDDRDRSPGEGNFRRVFADSERGFTNYRRVPVASNRGGRGANNSAPLFSGQLEFRGRQIAWERGSPGSAPTATLSLSLQINPTRFAAYQRSPRFMDGPPDRWHWGSPRLFARRTEMGNDEERPLDGNDNVIIGARQIKFCGYRAWPFQFERYWEGIQSMLHREFEYTARLAGCLCSFQPSIRINGWETYWEFFDDDPLGTLSMIEPIVFELARERSGRSSHLTQSETVRNASSLMIELRSGTDVVFYAKTNRRIRVEVRHDVRQNPRILGQSVNRTSDDFDVLYQWRDHLARRAVSDLNPLLNLIRHRALPRPGSHYPAYSLPLRVAEAADNPSLAQEIMACLVSNSSVYAPRSHALHGAITNLVRIGVLERARRGSPRFVVTVAYRSALATLRGG